MLFLTSQWLFLNNLMSALQSELHIVEYNLSQCLLSTTVHGQGNSFREIIPGAGRPQWLSIPPVFGLNIYFQIFY